MVTNLAKPLSPYYEDKTYRYGQTSPLSTPKADSGAVDDGSISFSKGEMTGRFEMGSTIVLIYETKGETTKTLV